MTKSLGHIFHLHVSLADHSRISSSPKPYPKFCFALYIALRDAWHLISHKILVNQGPNKHQIKLHHIKLLTSINNTSHLNFIFSICFRIFLCFFYHSIFQKFQKFFVDFAFFKIFPKFIFFRIFSDFEQRWLKMSYFDEDLWFLRLLLCTISSNEQFLFFRDEKCLERKGKQRTGGGLKGRTPSLHHHQKDAPFEKMMQKIIFLPISLKHGFWSG